MIRFSLLIYLDISRWLMLCSLVRNQRIDWYTWYNSEFPTLAVESNFTMRTHGVNNAEALKEGAVWFRVSGDYAELDHTIYRQKLLDTYHGQSSGVFSCDEHLAGLNPSRGTELCTVVELMFSHAKITEIFGHNYLLQSADRIEQLAFNALPASMTPDIWQHQYLQQANEIDAAVN